MEFKKILGLGLATIVLMSNVNAANGCKIKKWTKYDSVHYKEKKENAKILSGYYRGEKGELRKKIDELKEELEERDIRIMRLERKIEELKER